MIKNTTLCKHHKVSSLVLEYPLCEEPFVYDIQLLLTIKAGFH